MAITMHKRSKTLLNTVAKVSCTYASHYEMLHRMCTVFIDEAALHERPFREVLQESWASPQRQLISNVLRREGQHLVFPVHVVQQVADDGGRGADVRRLHITEDRMGLSLLLSVVGCCSWRVTVSSSTFSSQQGGSVETNTPGPWRGGG